MKTFLDRVCHAAVIDASLALLIGAQQHAAMIFVILFAERLRLARAQRRLRTLPRGYSTPLQ
jgi:hypothetical protein